MQTDDPRMKAPAAPGDAAAGAAGQLARKASASSEGCREDAVPSATPPVEVKLARQTLDKPRSFRGGMWVPKSFMIRDSGYRQRRLRTVEAKSKGLLRVRKVDHVFFGAWEELFCTIQDGALWCFQPQPQQQQEEASQGGSDEAGGPAVHSVKLCGAHLVVDHRTSGVSRGFKVVTDERATFQFQTVRHDDLLSWLQGLSSVPGLYRRPEDFFKVGRLLGKGATCKAFECTSRLTGKEFVFKVRADVKDVEGTKGMHNELRLLQKCNPFNHPSIPHLEDYFYEQDGKIVVVMERFRGGELFNKVMGENHFSEREAHSVFRQILEGVAFLHSQGIAHRDLKPSNMLIREAEGPMSIAIIDYDLAKVNYADVWESSTPCGTTPYMAPEIVRSFVTRDTQRRRYGTSVDMWSLGCVLHVLLTGKRPFDGKGDPEIQKAIAGHRMCLTREELGAVASPAAAELVMRLLAEKPEERPTAQECLEHEWVQSDPAALPGAPLPSPGNLRSCLTSAEVESLSSGGPGGADAEVSQRARDKLRRLLVPLQPPEGPVASCSRDASFAAELSGEQQQQKQHQQQQPQEKASVRRSMDIEALKVFLEETATLVSKEEGLHHQAAAALGSRQQALGLASAPES